MFKWIDQRFLDVWDMTIFKVGQSNVGLGNLIVSIAFIVLGFSLSRSVSRFSSKKLRPYLHDKSSVMAIENLVFYIVLVVTTLLGLTIANIPLTIFTLVGGAVAIGFGFGSQNIFKNFISGVILLFERPIKIGDFIEIEKGVGRVESIGFRSTKILIPSGKHVIVPNSNFLEQNVINWTHENSTVGATVNFKLTDDSDIDKARSILLECCRKDESILTDPAPSVLVSEVGPMGLSLDLGYTVEFSKFGDVASVSSRIRERALKSFRENNIKLFRLPAIPAER